VSANLGDWIAAQRWFRSRTRARTNTQIVDTIGLEDVVVSFVRVTFSEGPEEIYIVPRVSDHDAAAQFGDLVLRVMRGELPFRSDRLELRRGSVDLTGVPPGAVGRAEQTNTTIRFGDRLIMKLYRTAVVGPNPEVEILRFLAEHGGPDAPTPRLAGEVWWVTPSGERAAVAMVQTFVPSRGDAWQATLEALTLLLRDARGAPSPAALAAESARAHKLGARTAALHRALASPTDDAAFVPESTTSLASMGARVRRDFASVLQKLRSTGATSEAVQRLMASAPHLEARIDAATARPVAAFQTRTHGDFHLGQVLVTPEDDFVIIDFEGEPARPLDERRQKGLAVRDVAGMLRSFDYAAATVERVREGGPPGWVAAWRQAVSTSFVDAWWAGVVGSPAAPADEDELRRLLDLFLIEKAVYEIGYELDHRPEWVAIPIEGLLGLLSGVGGPEA